MIKKRAPLTPFQSSLDYQGATHTHANSYVAHNSAELTSELAGGNHWSVRG